MAGSDLDANDRANMNRDTGETVVQGPKTWFMSYDEGLAVVLSLARPFTMHREIPLIPIVRPYVL
jgi:hypothetical protein